MREIAPGVFVEQGYERGNVGLFVTDDGPILVDAPMLPEQARHWRETIRSVVDKPVVYLIHTDFHPEHTLGNRELGGTIVAHDRVYQEIKSYSEAARQRLLDQVRREYPAAASEIAAQPFALPELTFAHRMYLYCGGQEIQAIFVGGHTPATSMVHLPRQEVLFAGDVVVNGRYPVMTHANSKEWLDALTLIRRMIPRFIVPGSGDVCDTSVTDALSAYVREIRSAVRQQYQAGRSKSETISRLRKHEWPKVGGEERPGLDQQLKVNIGRVYDEIRGAVK